MPRPLVVWQKHAAHTQEDMAVAELNKPVFIGDEIELTNQVEQELQKVSLHRLGKQEELRMEESMFLQQTREFDKHVAQRKGKGDKARKRNDELEK